MGDIGLWHVPLEILGSFTLIAIFILEVRRADKKEQDKRHEENQNKLNFLVAQDIFLRPHDHQRPRNGDPLTYDGIIFRDRNGEGKR